MNKTETIVIKIGSSLLVDENSGKLRMNFLYHLMNDVAYFKERGVNVVLVSSGSVALGRRFCKVPFDKALTLSEKQAAAAHGQPVLMSAYQNFASEHDLRTPQIMLTLHDFEDRKRFLNAEDTLEELLKQGDAVPIVNENDTVATKHLRVGDNDRLAAKVAQLVEADSLIILTNVNGLWDANKKIIRKVDQLTDDIFSLAGGATGVGTGGMITKLKAAEIASASGCITHITSGHSETPVRNAFDLEHEHTVISSGTNPENARKLWIATSLEIQGSIEIPKESISKLENGSSVMPDDVINISGDFGRGDVISVMCEGQEVARGISAFYTYEVEALKGKQDPDVFSVLGYKTKADIVDENDLALLSND